MNVVRESILNEKSKLTISAGLVIIQNNKILLAHPTGSPWKKSYSIPKGHIEEGESLLQTAKRETYEEVGIDESMIKILDEKNPKLIDYKDSDGNIYKKVYYYLAKPRTKIDPKKLKLQKKEVDWVGFLDFEEAKKRISPRFEPLLKLIE